METRLIIYAYKQSVIKLWREPCILLTYETNIRFEALKMIFPMRLSSDVLILYENN